jgi:hypothetical protein
VEILKVKELIEKLKGCDQEAFVEIRNDKRWTADVYSVTENEYDHANVVEISSLEGHRFIKKPIF